MLLVMTLALFAILAFPVNKPLQMDSAPYGILSFELAGTVDASQKQIGLVESRGMHLCRNQSWIGLLISYSSATCAWICLSTLCIDTRLPLP
jgi:hypothetical protein